MKLDQSPADRKCGDKRLPAADVPANASCVAQVYHVDSALIRRLGWKNDLRLSSAAPFRPFPAFSHGHKRLIFHASLLVLRRIQLRPRVISALQPTQQRSGRSFPASVSRQTVFILWLRRQRLEEDGSDWRLVRLEDILSVYAATPSALKRTTVSGVFPPFFC